MASEQAGAVRRSKSGDCARLPVTERRDTKWLGQTRLVTHCLSVIKSKSSQFCIGLASCFFAKMMKIRLYLYDKGKARQLYD